MNRKQGEASLLGQHVGVVTTSYPADSDDPSGHFVRSEVQALQARGARVSVVAPRPAGRAVERTPGVHWLDGGAAFGFPGALARLRAAPLEAGAGAVRFVHAARRLLDELAPDRIVAHFLLPSAWPIASTLERAVPLEVVAHGSDVRLFARLPAGLRRHVAGRLAQAELRCVSHELAALLERALGSRGTHRIRVEASPLELPARLDRESARGRLGISPAGALAVVVGRLVRGKRVDSALRAARAIPGASAVVVGDGPERSALERAFPEARFVGQRPRSEALAWIAAADVLVSASREEGAPSVVREARALGTPVVAVAAGDLEAWSRDDPELWVVGRSPPLERKPCRV